MFSVIKYTLPNMLRGNIQTVVLNHLLESVFEPKFSRQPELIIVTSSDIPNLDSRVKQIVLPVEKPGHFDMYNRISNGLSHSKYDTIFLAEQDVLYPKSYFRDGLEAALQLNKHQVTYNMNVLTANSRGFFRNTPKYLLLSHLVGWKKTLQESISRRIEYINSGGNIVWAEPGMNWEGFTDCCVTTQYSGKKPSVDIRYGNNFTGAREAKWYRPFDFYWGRHKKIWKQLDL